MQNSSPPLCDNSELEQQRVTRRACTDLQQVPTSPQIVNDKLEVANILFCKCYHAIGSDLFVAHADTKWGSVCTSERNSCRDDMTAVSNRSACHDDARMRCIGNR